jgi:hypothetical protein
VKPSTLREAKAAKAKLAKLVKDSKGVNGVGITRNGSGYAVKLNLAAEADEDFPTTVDGVPIHVDIVGTIVKRPRQSRPKQRR